MILDGQCYIVADQLAGHFNPAVPGLSVIAGDNDFHDRGLPNCFHQDAIVLREHRLPS